MLGGGDEEIEIDVANIGPMLHNRWAVIAPALDLASNIAGDFQQAFKTWAIFAAQHGCQRNYDRKFREVVNGGDSGIGTGEVFPEDR